MGGGCYLGKIIVAPRQSVNLFNSTCRWNKKLEKEGLAAADDREIERMQRAKRNEQRLELEKVKQRRLEREREREERTKLMELEQRQRDNEKFSKWSRDEDDFHLQQARLRSKIRIIDGRAKPIDLVSPAFIPDEPLILSCNGSFFNLEFPNSAQSSVGY